MARPHALFTNPLSFLQKIRHYVYGHGLAFKLSLRNLLHTPLASLLTSFALAMTLCIPATGYLISKNVHLLTAGFDKGTTLTLYLHHHVTQNQAQILKNTLEDDYQIEEITYQTPAQALAEFKALSGLEKIINSLPQNPLPGVMTVYPKANYQTAELLDNLSESLKKHPEIAQVDADIDWAQKYHGIKQFGEAFMYILGLFVSIALLFIIGNIIKLSLDKHKEEAIILSRIGATPAFIQRPFLYRGLWLGLFSAFLSLILLDLTLHLLQKPTNHLAFWFESSFTLQGLGFTESLLLFAASGFLGLLGARLAVFTQTRSCR